MNEKGLKHFIKHRAYQVTGYLTGDSINIPMPDLAEECIVEDLSYLNDAERLLYSAVILRSCSALAVAVPRSIYKLLKE